MTKVKKRKNEQIISALLVSPTVKDAAKILNISEQTIYKRLENKEFKQQYDYARLKLLEQTTGYIQGLIAESIKTICDIMLDDTVSRQIQLNAANSILKYSFKFTEQYDIIKEIAELKKAVFEENE